MQNGLSIKVAILACAKQEELYIKEWIDWNKSLGVDHIYIADNNDSNYEPNLTDVIQDYINEGFVTVHNYNDIHPIQPICYSDLYEQYGYIYDWFFICDIDEFLHMPITNNNIKQFIYMYDNKGFNSIAINWRSYDDNGLVYYDDRPLQERFTNLANTNSIKNGERKVIKSIIRTKKYCKAFTVNHQHDPLCNYPLVKRCNVLMYPHYKQTNDENGNIQEKYKIAYIAHFEMKTLEEYFWKINRGDTLHKKISDHYPYKLNKFWYLNNKTPEKLELYNKIQQGTYEYNSIRK